MLGAVADDCQRLRPRRLAARAVRETEARVRHRAPLLLEAGQRRVVLGASEVHPPQSVRRGPLNDVPLEGVDGTHRQGLLVTAVVDRLDCVAEDVVHAAGYVAPLAADDEELERLTEQLLRQAQLPEAAGQRPVLLHRADVQAMEGPQIACATPRRGTRVRPRPPS